MQAAERIFLETVGHFIQQRISQWLAPIIGRVEKLESATAFTPAQQSEIERMIAAALAARGKNSNGTHGDNGAGATADGIRALVDLALANALAALPVSPSVVGSYIDRDGDLFFTNSDGSFFKVGHVVGKDADQAYIDAQIKAACEKYPPPKDGKDGFGLNDFQIDFDGERTWKARFINGDNNKEFSWTVPTPLYRDVWRDGEYQRGDMVTRDGSTFVALKDTATVPGTPNSDWRLCVKRGRDGKEGKQGPPGKDGRDGMDGRKWA